jgi:hypothetical protein
VYGSGGFTTYDDHAARAQLQQWTSGWGIPRVKIKIAESWGAAPGRDLARIAFARQVIGPDTELYMDANGGYARKQAIRMARATAEHDVTWFEEPVSSDDLDGLREVRDRVDPDVTAAVAAARGLQVCGHCAPNLHAHVAAAVPNLRHLESLPRPRQDRVDAVRRCPGSARRRAAPGPCPARPRPGCQGRRRQPVPRILSGKSTRHIAFSPGSGLRWGP